MRFLATERLTPEDLRGRHIYLDTDFLATLFEDIEALQGLLELSKFGYLVIDPNTRFEFLRGVFLPERRALLESFIDNDVFYPDADHQEIFKKIRVNALTLSHLYAHNGCKSASFVDLLLASKVLYKSSRAVLITGNRKDFPSAIFDVVGVLNYSVEKSGCDCIRSFSVLAFSQEKYEKAKNQWVRVCQKENLIH